MDALLLHVELCPMSGLQQVIFSTPDDSVHCLRSPYSCKLATPQRLDSLPMLQKIARSTPSSPLCLRGTQSTVQTHSSLGAEEPTSDEQVSKLDGEDVVARSSSFFLPYLVDCSMIRVLVTALVVLSASSFTLHQSAAKPSQLRMVSSTERIAVADMERGIGGRIEQAFESAKERGEAAFVTFVTAGYPTKDGA